MDVEHLFADIATALRSELVAFAELEGGSSANVWRLDLSDGMSPQRVVFRQHQTGELKDHNADVASKEYRLLDRLSDLGFPVARPLYLDEANRFLVTEFVAGDSKVLARDTASALPQMAELLLQLHAVDINSFGVSELPALEDPLVRLPKYLPDLPVSQVLAERLATNTIAVDANPPTLVHGDYWPGNLLWQGGQITALIDWEDACVGDPLADLAGARVELLCEYGAGAMQDFTTLYLSQTPHLDTSSLPVWECYASATALQSMHTWGLEPGDEAHRRRLTEVFFADAVTRCVA